MLSVAEALAVVMRNVQPSTRVQRIPLLDAVGRVVAQDLPARSDSPAFDNSAMDGYAVRASDLAQSGVRLPVQGESRAGGAPPPALEPGKAMRIFTGAPMPEGADSVVIQENAAVSGDGVTFAAAAELGRNVRVRGSDLEAGAVALAKGYVVGPGEVALLASQHYASCEVCLRPRVAILSSGDELLDIGEPSRPGSIVNSNAYMLAAQVRRAGGEPWVLPPMPDDLETASQRVEHALEADVVLCSGGVSVGDYDIVPKALAKVGATAHFAKVAMKPGKPLAFSSRGGVPIFGLPGNPASAFVGFELFVRPALRRMLGDARPYPSRITVALSAAHQRKPGRLELARARLACSPHGFTARLSARQGSGALPALVGVDALVVFPPEQTRFEVGAKLDALLLEGPGSRNAPFDPVD